MKKIIRRVPNILESAIKSVFVFGESGVGKEVVANIFEEYLRKQTKTLLRVNCASFTSSLLTSELFGYEKGAFTGAMKTKIGIFEKADNGWIFLDEVTTLSLDAQCSLLRVLESQEIRRVGSNKSIKINVKIVCATNENVEELIKAGKFREDLWQRLQEVIISIPPLRERPDEMDAIIDGLCKTIEGGPYKITASTKSLLKSLKWEKGNIRELRNCLRAMTENYLSKENIFTPISIPTRVWDKINSKNKYENDEISSKISFDINKYNKPYRALKKELLYTLILKFIKGNNEKLKLATLASKIGVSKTILARSLEEGVKEGRLRKDDIINSVWINV